MIKIIIIISTVYSHAAKYIVANCTFLWDSPGGARFAWRFNDFLRSYQELLKVES